MKTLEEILDIDPDSPSMVRATQLVENDRALLRRLVAIRKEQSLTQEDVAQRLGVTQATVSRFEAYDSNPTLASIRRYAHAIEALVNHDVERDEGQLLDPARRERWIPMTTHAAAQPRMPRPVSKAEKPDFGAARFPGGHIKATTAQCGLTLAA